MHKLKLKSSFKPTADQNRAINQLCLGIKKGIDYQVLLGVTGSGKTFSIANLIERTQRPTLVISHNKTLAAQLYQEFRDFFPENAVSYFVSYYDYYQPEAYIPSTDTYIEKDAGINELIDKLRLASTTNLLTRNDVIVIASVSCIYNIGSPKEYGNFIFELTTGKNISRKAVIDRLIELQYERSDFGFHRGTFRVRGGIIDIYPAYQDEGIRLELGTNNITDIKNIDPVSGNELTNQRINESTSTILYPAKHFITDPTKNDKSFKNIKKELFERVKDLKAEGKDLEAHRLKQKVNYDLEMIYELGYVKGIENYSRYFDGRAPGEPPFTLLDYFNEPFNKNWLVVIDESHITFPQIRGMHAGDLSRKKTLIEYGFRLPSALDNRPLTFDEFLRRIPNFVATSATPSNWEVSLASQAYGKRTTDFGKKRANGGIVEQLLRPTGIPDPEVEIRPVETQVKDVIEEVKKLTKKKNIKKRQRTLITTLTKQTAEDLSNYLKEKGIKVHYLHSDVKTLERTKILDDLRRGNYDCLVGVNLLREGLDLPEVSLVAILDADKEGFLRSEVSLIQTMGRAARHKDGKVIMYAQNITSSMKRALAEVDRRRDYQLMINKKYGIKPKTIKKPIREILIEVDDKQILDNILDKQSIYKTLGNLHFQGLTPMDKKKMVSKLRREMRVAAKDLNFELAAEIRDKIRETKY